MIPTEGLTQFYLDDSAMLMHGNCSEKQPNTGRHYLKRSCHLCGWCWLNESRFQ